MIRYILTLLLLTLTTTLLSQTRPRKVANTGLDGDLHADTLKFGSIPGSASGTDDWFFSGGTGSGLIDTTGAARIRYLYATRSGAARNFTFGKKGFHKLYTPVNGNLVIGATFGRDNVSVSGGSNPDSTIFTSLPSFGSSKNGMNPRYWKSEPTSVPNNDDLIEAYTAFRRGGLSVTDSLWLLGTVVRIGTSGVSFFDFEYIQDTMKLNRTSGRFTFGPDSGHTAWQFDPTTGQATKIGDVVFAAEFGTSGLSAPQLRIWVRYKDWRVYNARFPSSPLKFILPSAGGQYDGANGTSNFSTSRDTFGYAQVQISGTNIVYNMPNNTARTTAGPWGATNASNALLSYWPQNSSLDFAVNLTALGVDPYQLFTDPCAPIYSSFMAKSRSSGSFTSDLKDLIGPLDLRIPELVPVTATTDTLTCKKPVITLVGKSAGALSYFNPYWKWKANSGSGFVISPSTPTPIAADTVLNDTAYVNKPGTYTITLAKFKGCATAATATVTVVQDTATVPANIQVVDSLCTGTSAFRAKIFTVSSVDTALYTLVVTGPSGYNKRNKFRDTVLTAGTYTATITTKRNGCARVKPISIGIFPGCTITLSGTVWDDGNGTYNGALDGVTIQKPSTTLLYAYLINNTTNTVLDSQYILSNGTYSLTANSGTSGLAVLLSTTQYAVGAVVGTSNLPTNWLHVGEVFGTGNGAGSGFSATTGAVSADGRILVNTGTTNITGVDFGINMRPESDNKTAASQVNPGGTVQVAVPALTGSDLEDGTLPAALVRTVIIDTLPSNATLYYNGIAVTAGQVIPAYNSSLLTVDPNFNGAGTVVFRYSWRDSAQAKDLSPATVTMPFTGLTVSGTVYHDPDGLIDGQVDGTGMARTGTDRITAYLVNASNVVVDSTRVNLVNGTYLLENADANSSYTVRISTIQTAIGSTAPASASPTNGWVLTGETFGSNNAAGTGVEGGAPNGRISTSTTTLNITGVDFGLEVPPYAKDKTYALNPDSLKIITMWRFQRAIYLYSSNFTLDTTVNSLSTARRPGGLSGYDPEDGRYNGQTGVIPDTMVLRTLPDTTNALLSYFNGSTWVELWPNPQVGSPSYPYWDPVNNRYELANFDSTQLRMFVKLAFQNTTSFQYAYIDNAGILGTTATYTISWTSPLPVSVLKFTATLKKPADVNLKWQTSMEEGIDHYQIYRNDPDGSRSMIGSRQARNLMVLQHYHMADNLSGRPEGLYQYQLYAAELDGTNRLAGVSVVSYLKEGQSGIRVSPVPADREIRVTLPVEETDDVATLELLDATGKQVRLVRISEKETVMQTGDLAEGVYMLRHILPDGRAATVKLIIQH